MRSRALPPLALAMGLAVALALAGGTSGAATRTYVPRDCLHEAVKPHQIIVTCADAGFVLIRLDWSHWGRRSATARGTANINDCKPFCAEGHFHKYPVTVRLSRPRFCSNTGKTQFRRLRVTFTGNAPGGLRRTSSQPIACPLK